MIDSGTAKKKHFATGDTIGVQSRGPVERLRISGLVHFGAVASIGGATLAGFDLGTAQKLFDKEGAARPDPRREEGGRHAGRAARRRSGASCRRARR